MRKFVVNDTFGGFGFSDDGFEYLVNSFTNEEKSKYGTDKYDVIDNIERDNAKLVAMVEKLGVNANSENSFLMVYYVPDEATDTFIYENDGCETLLYCMDGKINYATLLPF